MNYLNIYADLINKSRQRLITSRIGFHLHHIVPKSLGGTDDLENLVFLTHKEHMLAHTLLAMQWSNQWFSVEMIGLRTLHKLPRWKRKCIAHRRAYLQRNARINR
jgi:hypothetical protein